MPNLSQFEAYTGDLNAAVKILTSNYLIYSDHEYNPPQVQPLIPADAPDEAHRARQSILVAIARLQGLVAGPADFLQHLATQSQLLACLQWLGEFQVLACIPLAGSVPIKDVADLAGVPENQLGRVIRMTATAGFLQEPQPGHIAHSALSAPFVSRPSYLDAGMFLAGTVAPAALQMATATQRFGSSMRPNETAYNLAINIPVPFANACEQRAKLQRQWPVFLRYGTGDVENRVTDLLARLEQFRRGDISVVEVGARCTKRAMTLSNLYPSIHFIVQLTPSSTDWISPIQPSTPCSKHGLQPNASNGASTTTPSSASSSHAPGITVQQRSPATPQPIPGAAVYILHLPSPSPSTSFSSLAARIVAELRAHLDILRANPAASLVLAPRLLPEPGTVNADVEATARLRDLTLLQLANEREIEIRELMNMFNSVSDSMGRLVVVNKLRARDSVAIVLELRYQPYNR